MSGRWVLALWYTALFLVALGGTAYGLHQDGSTYSKAEVRALIATAADCHAEFFYTHDPAVTGVGIEDALRACDPFGK